MDTDLTPELPRRRGREKGRGGGGSHLDGQILVDEDGQGRLLLAVVEDGEGVALALAGTEAAQRRVVEKSPHVVRRLRG